MASILYACRHRLNVSGAKDCRMVTRKLEKCPRPPDTKHLVMRGQFPLFHSSSRVQSYNHRSAVTINSKNTAASKERPAFELRMLMLDCIALNYKSIDAAHSLGPPQSSSSNFGAMIVLAALMPSEYLSHSGMTSFSTILITRLWPGGILLTKDDMCCLGYAASTTVSRPP